MCEVPGVSRVVAETVIAETGADMSRFPTPQQLCAWAGVAPGNHESAGKRRPAGTRKGQRWLRRALIEAAKSLSRSNRQLPRSPLPTHRPTPRPEQGSRRCRTQHLDHPVAPDGRPRPQRYHDLGADYYERRRDPEREARRLVAELAKLGYTATLEPAALAAQVPLLHSGLRPERGLRPRTPRASMTRDVSFAFHSRSANDTDLPQMGGRGLYRRAP